MMLDQDAAHSQNELPIEGLPASPVGGNLYDICDQNALFSDPLPDSGEVQSCSACCYDDSSYTNDLSSLPLAPFGTSYLDPAAAAATSTSVAAGETFSALLDQDPEDVPPFLPCPPDQFELPDVSCYAGGYPAPPLGSVFDDPCACQLPAMQPAYGQVEAGGSAMPCTLYDQYAGAMNGLPGPYDAPVIFSGGLLPDSTMHAQDLDFQAESSAFYGNDSVFASGELQQVLNETQQPGMVKAGAGSLASDMSTLEETSFKVGRLSVEERKEKIHRYMKKRNERNFSKKIKYACRKTLADSRPRVRGRFAKNDEFGDAPRPSSSHDEEEEELGVKEEDHVLESSDILAQVTGMNSFECNYPIQSWKMGTF